MKWTAYLAVAAVILAVAASLAYRGYGYKQLNDAMAEVAKTDDAWKWEYLHATRKEVADKDNAALVVLAAVKDVPDDWPGKVNGLAEIKELAPNVPLKQEQAERLRDELAKVRQPLAELGKLGENSVGRYPRPGELTGPLQQPFASKPLMTVADLLWLDAVWHANEGKTDVALAGMRGVLLVGQTVGDEPDMLAQVARVGCRRKACAGIQRVLAQRQDAKPEALRASQKLLEIEETANVLRQGLRGERVLVDELLQQVADGKMAIDGLEGEPSALDRLNNWLQGGRILESRARCLQVLSEAATIAGEPLEYQVQKFGALKQTVAELKDSRRFALAYLALQVSFKSLGLAHASQAELRCAMTGLAAEQYRLKNGSWPDSLEKLVPEYLAAIPTDPFAPCPLQFQAREDGITVASVGPDGKAIQFRLWNVNQRAKPPATR
jgi:hypothetical protein